MDSRNFCMEHYALIVSETGFDSAFERIQHSGARFPADPGRKSPGKIKIRDRGRLTEALGAGMSLSPG